MIPTKIESFSYFSLQDLCVFAVLSKKSEISVMTTANIRQIFKILPRSAENFIKCRWSKIPLQFVCFAVLFCETWIENLLLVIVKFVKIRSVNKFFNIC